MSIERGQRRRPMLVEQVTNHQQLSGISAGGRGVVLTGLIERFDEAAGA